MIRRVFELINKIPREERKHIGEVCFVVEKDIFHVNPDGSFVAGRYVRDLITIYESVIQDDDHLKKVLKHELAHHFGMNEVQVGRYFNER